MLLWDRQLTLTQRRVDHPGNVRQKYVYVVVGTGSNEQDFTGDVMMIRRISACVHSRNYASDDVVGEITGGGGSRPAVL